MPPGFVGQFETVLVNNPRGYTPNIGELGKALKPGGRIIVQGRGRVGPDSPKNRRGFNPDFQRLLDEPAPPGYRKTTDASEGGLAPDKGNTSKDILGGPFYSTEGDRRIHPNARVIFEKLPTGPTGGGPAPIGPSGLPGETGPATASPRELPVGGPDAATPVRIRTSDRATLADGGAFSPRG